MSIIRLSVALPLGKKLFSFTCFTTVFNSRYTPDRMQAGIIVANQREQILPVVMRCRAITIEANERRKKTLGRSAVLSENSRALCWDRSIVSWNGLDRPELVTSTDDSAVTRVPNGFSRTNRRRREWGTRVIDAAGRRRKARWFVRSLVRSPVQATILSSANGALTSKVSWSWRVVVAGCRSLLLLVLPGRRSRSRAIYSWSSNILFGHSSRFRRIRVRFVRSFCF